ncbi:MULTISPECIES: LysR substrate-binding domain-containing protein [Pseudomonas]|jgi:LysR family glycine cleavage system transcriptional activator|uniref:LysR substrate-binding domain-containing protein n=1 Tax=Pseudomonas TaxID=286 RepID=UPI00029D0E0C|nr:MULTISPECIES: LysR substrate-binding domain-containing protein [Pseudomonas]AFY18083.1 LysR family transcriptional regulator [Pseudomonas sp. UW4]QXH62897.1 LysR family transcriptional regulator [Pseudomonas azerbaijanorientalis]
MRFPSMTALRALDAVARLGSVSVAARELNLTRSAISHQISKLEECVGFALTERIGRGIGLTYQGERYAREVHGILLNLLDAGQLVDDQEISGRLCVSCAPGFATYWLCHHIGAFLRQYPQVQLQLISPRTPDDVNNPAADLCIAYGIGDWPEMIVEEIVALRFFPVCSPRLINALGGLKSPQELSSYPLLHMTDYSDWRVWLTAAGASGVNATSGILFSDAHCAQSACIAGQGIAIGDNLISGDALSKGLLVRPFDITIDLHRGYYLAADPQKADRAVVQAFGNWIKTQLQSSRQTWQDTL